MNEKLKSILRIHLDFLSSGRLIIDVINFWVTPLHRKCQKFNRHFFDAAAPKNNHFCEKRRRWSCVEIFWSGIEKSRIFWSGIGKSWSIAKKHADCTHHHVSKSYYLARNNPRICCTTNPYIKYNGMLLEILEIQIHTTLLLTLDRLTGYTTWNL